MVFSFVYIETWRVISHLLIDLNFKLINEGASRAEKNLHLVSMPSWRHINSEEEEDDDNVVGPAGDVGLPAGTADTAVPPVSGSPVSCQDYWRCRVVRVSGFLGLQVA